MADHDIDLSQAKKQNQVVYGVPDTSPNDGGDHLEPVPVAKAVALNSFPAFSTTHLMTNPAMQALKEQGFPMGLAQELGQTKTAYPFRFWIVDNSGSMQASDGHELRGTKSDFHVVPCTRWKELQGTIEYHAELGGLIEATTTFRLLNDPGAAVGPQEFTVGDMASTLRIDQEVDVAIGMVQRTTPGGVTPLTRHIDEIASRIGDIQHELQQNSQKAVVVIATDGLPSDASGYSNDTVKQKFIEALQRLQQLPVWVVVRLCTNDDSVVEYYNDLDKVLELPMECLDDFLSEAAEIMAVNPWINYTLPIHRVREMGYQHRIFDLLDERLLNRDELREYLVLLFGEASFRHAPDIQTDWKGFAAVLQQVVKTEQKAWNPMTRRVSPWIDMKQLHKIYRDKRGFFGFGRKR